jgi:hypothetical protein
MPIIVPDLSTLQELVLNKCDSFVSMGIWPAGERLRYRKWLDNFEDQEKECALYLLNSFVYYNLDMCIALLKSSFINLWTTIPFCNKISQQYSIWRQFIADSIFVPAIGESHNVTDSGNLLASYIRRELGIPQDNILTVDQLYDAAYLGLLTSSKRIIFFDDFIGSGQQFITMWNNDFEKDAKFLPPIKKTCSDLKLDAHYCAMISTKYGADYIKNEAPEVKLHFSHLLLPQASPLSPNSVVWPHHLKTTGPNMILNASKRAGIPVADVGGFYELGLAVAFSFTIPDATLPIFRWDKNNWTPLMERN